MTARNAIIAVAIIIVAGAIAAVVLRSPATGRDAPAPALTAVAEPPPRPTDVTPPTSPPPTAEPAMSDPRMNPGARLIAGGRYRQARAILEPILEDHPGSARTAFLIGITYHKQQRYGLAIELFERANELNTDFPERDQPHYFLGWAQYRLGRLEPARAAFEYHLTLKPDKADSHFGLGVVAFEDDEIEDAERHLRRALELFEAEGDSREIAKTHARIADVLVRRGNHEAAEIELQRAVELFPDHYEAWHKLYGVQVRLGKDAEAAASLAEHERAAARAAQRRAAANR